MKNNELLNSTREVIDDDWELVKSFFPKNWRWLSKRTKVLKGLRKAKDPEQLIRALLMHLGCGYSLRETAVRAKNAKICNMSDVALLKRLRKSSTYFHQLCCSLFKETGRACKIRKGLQLKVIDSTIIKEPGKTGSLWRIHYSIILPTLRSDFFDLTPAKGKGNGDSMLRYPLKAGEYVIADRGYSHASGIHYAASAGAYVCVRVNHSGLKILSPDKSNFGLLEKVKTLRKTGQIGEWDVLIPNSEGEFVHGRICAVRKSAAAIANAQRKLRRNAQKQQSNLRPETLEFAKYVILFTTFPKADFSAEELLELYRYRWQIELKFKRFKQVLQLGHLPKKDPQSIKAWLYGKLFVSLLIEKIIDHASFFSPWGYELEKVENTK